MKPRQQRTVAGPRARAGIGALLLSFLLIGQGALAVPVFVIPRPGLVVHANDPVQVTVLRGGGPAWFCWVDSDADGLLGFSEAVYYAAACGAVSVFDLRVANPAAGFVKGSLVRQGDSDVGADLSEFEHEFLYDDAGDDSAYTGGDVVYAHSATATSDVVLQRDVILSGPMAGTVVEDNQHGLNNDLLTFTNTAATMRSFFDRDASRGLSIGDEVYLDVDVDDFATIGDIRWGSAANFGIQLTAHDEPTLIELVLGGGNNPPSSFCFEDESGDGNFQSTERVFLSSSCGTISARDVRIANPISGQAKGSQVRPTQSDGALATVTLDGALAYRDLDGDDGLSANDTLYWDLAGTGASEVSPLDIVLTGAEAGNPAGSTDTGADLKEIAAGISSLVRFADSDADGSYTYGDHVYLDMDEDGLATIADVQLFEGSFGILIGPQTVATTGILATDAPDEFCYRDANADGSLQAGESIYLAANCAALAVGDVVLTGSGRTSGERVAESEEGNAIATLNGALSFRDLDGNDYFTGADTLYWDLDQGADDEGQSGTVTELDLILSGAQGGSLVAADSVEIGAALKLAPSYTFGYLDDGDDTFDVKDSVYLDWSGPGEGYVTTQDVRMAEYGHYEDRPAGTSPAATTPPATSPPSGQVSSPTTTPPAGTTPPTQTRNPEPGFEAVALALAVLGAIVAFRRRK